MITVREADCHPDTCLDVEGPEGHNANVNPIGFSHRWRVDCDGCGTCIHTAETKKLALWLAMTHVIESSEEYWQKRLAQALED